MEKYWPSYFLSKRPAVCPSVYKSTEESIFAIGGEPSFAFLPLRAFQNISRRHSRTRRIIFIQFVPRNNSPIHRGVEGEALLNAISSEWRAGRGKVARSICWNNHRVRSVLFHQRVKTNCCPFLSPSRVDYLVMFRSRLMNPDWFPLIFRSVQFRLVPCCYSLPRAFVSGEMEQIRGIELHSILCVLFI